MFNLFLSLDNYVHVKRNDCTCIIPILCIHVFRLIRISFYLCHGRFGILSLTLQIVIFSAVYMNSQIALYRMTVIISGTFFFFFFHRNFRYLQNFSLCISLS